MKKRLLALLLLAALLLAGCGAPAAPEPGAGLEVHFLDVGQADCILVASGGECLLIDGGNREDSRLVVSYLEELGVQELEAVVCTHPHEDHVGGLPGVLAVYPTHGVYAPSKTYASKVYDNFLYYTDQQGLDVTIPAPGDTLTVGQATLTVMGPVKSYAETNDTSLVLRLDYGDTRFLFTGDMETAAETDMADYWADTPGALDVDVLKVGHHGSDTSTGYRLLHETTPTQAVISVGTGNTYGHPHEQPLSRLAQAEVEVLRTDLLGTIVARSDGKQVHFTWENAQSQPQIPQGQGFIGNVSSKKFHTPTCPNLPAPKNQVSFETYQQAQDAGYAPCGNCLGK